MEGNVSVNKEMNGRGIEGRENTQKGKDLGRQITKLTEIHRQISRCAQRNRRTEDSNEHRQTDIWTVTDTTDERAAK